MPSRPLVRTEQASDADAIERVLTFAFAPSTGESQLVRALRNGPASVPQLWLVAELDGEVVGHIAYSVARLGADHSALALAPMAVHPDHQANGIGGLLVEESLRRAQETDFPLVVVLGHADYYPRFGFSSATQLGITAPFEVPDEAWMALQLQGYTPDARGKISYAAEFDSVT